MTSKTPMPTRGCPEEPKCCCIIVNLAARNWKETGSTLSGTLAPVGPPWFTSRTLGRGPKSQFSSLCRGPLRLCAGRSSFVERPGWGTRTYASNRRCLRPPFWRVPFDFSAPKLETGRPSGGYDPLSYSLIINDLKAMVGISLRYHSSIVTT